MQQMDQVRVLDTASASPLPPAPHNASICPERQTVDASIAGEPHKYGTPVQARTRAVLIYKKTGNRRTVRLLLVHAKLGSTVHYHGMGFDVALQISE
jgi:hypothetical protein